MSGGGSDPFDEAGFSDLRRVVSAEAIAMMHRMNMAAMLVIPSGGAKDPVARDNECHDRGSGNHHDDRRPVGPSQ